MSIAFLYEFVLVHKYLCFSVQHTNMPRLTVYHGRVVCWIVGDGEIEVINCYRGPTKYSGRNCSGSSSGSSRSCSRLQLMATGPNNRLGLASESSQTGQTVQ